MNDACSLKGKDLAKNTWMKWRRRRSSKKKKKKKEEEEPRVQHSRIHTNFSELFFKDREIQQNNLQKKEKQQNFSI